MEVPKVKHFLWKYIFYGIYVHAMRNDAQQAD